MVRLDTEWTAERKSYRGQVHDAAGNSFTVTMAEARQTESGVRVTFYDDHHLCAERTLLAPFIFPNWDAVDFAVLLVANIEGAQ